MVIAKENPDPMADTPAPFLGDLLDPRTTITVDLVGFPSPLRQPAPWDTGGWRRLQEHLIYLILGDACLLDLDHQAEPQRLEPGAWICCPPGLHFRLRLASAEGTALIERFRLTVTRDGHPCAIATDPLVLPRAWGLAEPMAAVVRAGEMAGGDRDIRLRAHLALLFADALRLATGTQETGTVLSPGDCSRLRLFVRRRLPHWPGPADLARELNLSPDYFARVFRRTLGISPRTWLVDERIRCAAASLLENNDPVSAVAEAHGYTDLTLFGRQFRQVMGQPPRSWREQHRTFSLEEVG